MHPVAAIDVLFQPAEGVCASPETALAAMDAAGIAVAFVAPCVKLTCERQWACVDTRLEDVARYLGASIRFAGLCGFNPFDAAESLREMHAARAMGFRGVFVQLASFGLPLGDERYYPLFATASELQVPAVVQCSAVETAEERVLEKIGRDFSELSLAVAPEAGRSKSAWAELVEVAGEFDGLSFVLDTAAWRSITAGQSDLLADERFIERCMWGSSGAALAATRSEMSALPIPPAALSAFFRTNALRFFATQPPGRRPQALDRSITTAER